MKLHQKFVKVESSPKITGYVEDRFSRLQKLEWKPWSVRLTFSAERHAIKVVVALHGREINVIATAKGENAFAAVDAVIGKLSRQLARIKGRVKNHFVRENSHDGKLERLEQDRWDKAS